AISLSATGSGASIIGKGKVSLITENLASNNTGDVFQSKTGTVLFDVKHLAIKGGQLIAPTGGVTFYGGDTLTVFADLHQAPIIDQVQGPLIIVNSGPAGAPVV